MSVIFDVLIQYVTMTLSVCTQHSIIVIPNPTCFGNTKQPLSGFTFRKHIKEICVSVAVHTTVTICASVAVHTTVTPYMEMSILHKNICECHFCEAVVRTICKVKCTLVQALRLCTGRTAHRWSRGIALLYRH
jgi:hypothetical protein